jgi:hypothetical protein
MREWTEQDEESLRRSERERKLKQIQIIREDAEKHYRTSEENYNCTGSASSYRTMEKWQRLLDVCAMAQESIAYECPRCEHKRQNGKAIVSSLEKRKEIETTIPIDEVISLIYQVTV